VSLSNAFLDELRARTSLSGLIGRTVKLTKAGNEQKGCCPFHTEKSPSFYVNDDKAFYHCFGCSAHGDAIRWMTDQRGMPFMDAVKELAAAAGMDMPAQDPRQAERDREHAALYDVMRRAADWFARNMTDPVVASPSGGPRFLAERGIDALAAGFNIGWAPGGRNAEPLHRFLKDVAPETLVKVGLAKIHDEGERKGEVFDFFRARVMFPIRDNRGRVIAFGGRVVGDGQPKYLNSPDTPIFDKGRSLFNIDRAAPAARAAKRLLVVEGYMDVIGLARVGVDEVVAPNGTALTEDQIARLWRLSDTPILCFDGDKAGKAAAARAALRALPLLGPDRSLSFVTPPDGMDPDDVAKKGGKEAVDAMLAAPKPLVQVVWEHEISAGPTDTPEQRAGLAKRLREQAGRIKDGAVARAYLDDFRRRYTAHIAADTGPRRAPIRNAAPVKREPFKRPPVQSSTSKGIRQSGIGQNVERAIVDGLIRHPEVVRAELETLSAVRFTNAFAEALREMMIDRAIEGSVFEVPEELSDYAIHAQASPLRFSFTTNGHDRGIAQRDLAEALYQLRR